MAAQISVPVDFDRMGKDEVEQMFGGGQCRWGTYDALKTKIKPPDGYPPIIQERAWSSPIWYTPAVKAQTAR
jgi:hypothetical protein